MHTFPKHNEVLVDVFPCKEFDSDRVIKMAKDFFGTTVAKISRFES